MHAAGMLTDNEHRTPTAEACSFQLRPGVQHAWDEELCMSFQMQTAMVAVQQAVEGT